MRHRLLVALLAALALGACRAAGPVLHSGDVAVERAVVDSTTTAFHAALRTNDLRGFMAHVADSVVFMPPGEPLVRGRAAVETWMQGFLSAYRTTALTLGDREIFLGGDWAVEVGTYTWVLEPVAGGAAVADKGNYMQVWQRGADGRWRFARELYNSSLPAAP